MVHGVVAGSNFLVRFVLRVYGNCQLFEHQSLQVGVNEMIPNKILTRIECMEMNWANFIGGGFLLGCASLPKPSALCMEK